MKRLIFLTFIVSIIAFNPVEAQKKKSKKSKSTSTETTQPNATQPVQSTQPSSVTMNASLANDNSLKEVEAKGVGLKRDDALQDALRNAVSQAAGVAISSETSMENFMVVRDAVSAKTEGYVASYNVIKETPFPDRYEIIIQAKVSLNPLKADMQLLSKAIGGVRFLVMYDARKVKPEEKPYYDYAVERINEFLAERKYRYIEKERASQLLKEAEGIYQNSETNQESYVQHIGMKADAQFIILISNISTSSRSEAFDTRTATKVIIEAKAYDNCTAEGLGTIALESDWKSGMDAKSTMYENIKEGVNKGITKLLYLFNSYIGGWVNNGTPFELRFYSIGTFRDFRELRNKMLSDSRFGGQIEIVSFDNYTKLNLTYKDRPDELAYKILDFADAIPEFKQKVLDVKLIYGRQINFAPQKVKVQELEIKK
ncbi:MAG: hypothetical protein HPY79_06485 [Bacteroidales bacterium]|nr:hypothetical protein [Bacteroidales bacterium]